ETTTVGSRFPLAEAHDPDSGSNSLQRYELSGDEHFSLAFQTAPDGEKHPQLVPAKALDREEAAFHDLVLTAVDGGDPSRTGTARIHVVVLDANDNAPVFSQAVYTVRVREDVPVGSVLLTVSASDADDGVNGEVKYSLKKSTDLTSEIFHLDTKTGAITLVKNLDYEEGDSYELQLQAKDVEGEMKVYAIEVEVRDINDNAPSFREVEAELKVSEATAIGSHFLLGIARDPDSGSFSLQRYELRGDEHFALDVQTAPDGEKRPELVLVKALDREEAAFHELVLTAVDGGDPARTGTRVVVLDANDNSPVFSQAVYAVALREDVPVGSTLLIVSATDADVEIYGKVTFS
ncbi:Protocadherin gamma-A7, partial [Tinamus guttatus]